MKPIPTTIFIKILSYLNINEIKKVILLNSKFYEFVQIHPELNQRFCLKVDHSSDIFEEKKLGQKIISLFKRNKKDYTENAKAILSSTRQIKNFVIGTPHSTKVDLSSDVEDFAKDFVEKFGRSLQTFQINGKSRNNFLIALLRNLTDIETLAISNITFKKAIKPYLAPEFLKLKKLTYDSFFSNVDSDFLAVFDRVTTLRTFELMKSKMQCTFYLFLSKQTRLKELTVETSGAREFLKRFGTMCPFTLKKFWISDKSFYDEDYFLLANFIRNQSKITDLKIELGRYFDPVLCQAILNLPRLKYLSLDLLDFESSPEKLANNNRSVRFLKLNISSLQVVQKFPGVQNLKLIAYKDDILQNVSLDMLKNLKRVSLEINVTSLKLFITLQLSDRLKELVLNHVFGTDQGWKAIFLNNPNIEVLRMVNCGFNDEHNIFEANAQHLQNLKRLYCSFSLSPELIDYLKRQCTNLEQIWSQLGRLQVTYTKIYQKENV